jgi:murein DD-endopeptidase MepM/ murein hydrolase activator NlpD
VIRVPALDPPGEGDTGAGQAVGGIIHVVRPRETLVGIAVHHGVSMWSILGASHITNPALIYPGQELLIPGEGSGYLPAPFLWVEVQPLPAGQGSTAVVAVRVTEPVTLTATVLGQTIRFSEEAGVYYGLVGIHAFFEPGVYELVLSATDGAGEDSTLSTGFVVDAGRYGYERINVPASRANLLNAEVVAAERARLDQLAQTYRPERRWTGPLMRPGTGTVSSYFGTRRSYGQGPYSSYHAGTDFRGPTGTPVYVSAAGTVVLAEMLAIHGNIVVVDHGWGLLTGYAHLSAMEVVVGDVIGKIGNTGLSTAAHLHWQVWVSGISVDGLQWLDANYPWPRLDVRGASDPGDLGALPTECRSVDLIAGPPWVAGLIGLPERCEMNGQGRVGQGATFRVFGADPVGAPRTL